MALDDGRDGLLPLGDVRGGDAAAYRDGYARVMREIGWARAHGFVPTERELVLALNHAGRVYATVRGGKFVGGQHPEWVHGRMDALRALLRNGIGALPGAGSADRDTN